MSRKSTQKAYQYVELARGTDIRIGLWKSKVDITIAPLDDRKFYLGMDFLDSAKTFIVPYANTLFITGN